MSRREAERSVLPPDWTTLSPLLDTALDTPLELRAALLVELSGGDERRLGQLQQLLAECEQDAPFLERPAGERFASLFVDDADIPLPQILGGRYRIEREIGRGGMARVYLAHDEKHARSVAVKVIRPDLAASLGRERFLREIGIAARLRHPNIVPLYDSGDTDGVLHFVMPYEEGPSLRARLASGTPLTVSERVSILRDVARAIMYAHEHGIVHRDVKPDNVMLSGGAAVVTDFGIAKAVSVAQGATPASTLTQSGAGIGTPAYMAPEQAVGDPGTDHRADIYSFGCLAYELFAGHPPFHGMPVHQIIAAHMGTEAVAVDEVSRDVPAGVALLIGRCLEKSPDARPQSARELLTRLEGDSISPEPSSGGGLSSAPAMSVADRVSVDLDPSSRATGVHRWIPWMALPIVAVVAGVFLARALRTNDAPPEPIGARQLRILPMINETGDPRLDYVASGITEGISGRLQRSGGFIVRPGAPSEWPASSGKQDVGSSVAFGSTVLLRSVLARAGDSLELRASVLDAATKGEKTLAARRFATSQLQEVESRLAAAVSGAVFRVARPNEPRAPDRPIDSLSYRLTLEGWHQVFTLRNTDSAKKLFERATELDENNARAWSGLTSIWGRQTITNMVPFDVGYERTSTAAAHALKLDSLQGSALASLGFVTAWKYRSVAAGEALLKKAKEAEPSNPEIYQVELALYRQAWQWEKALDAARIAQELDPLRSGFVGHEADILACQNRLSEAERVLQREIAVNPTSRVRRRLPPILARLGRYDDAIAAMRAEAGPGAASPDSALLASARGSEGYWSIVQGRGRARLARLVAQGQRRWVSPYHLMIAQFQAGDTAGAYASLAKFERERDLRLVNLFCADEIDAERENPRLAAALKRIPAFPLR